MNADEMVELFYVTFTDPKGNTLYYYGPETSPHTYDGLGYNPSNAYYFDSAKDAMNVPCVRKGGMVHKRMVEKAIFGECY